MLQCLGEENTEIVNTKKANARIQSTAVRDVDGEERCRGRRKREDKRGEEEEEEEDGGEEEEEEEEGKEEAEEEEEEEEEEYDYEDSNNNRSELGFLVLQALGRFMFSLLVNGLQKSIKSTQKIGGPVDPSLTWGEVRPLSRDHDNQITSFNEFYNFFPDLFFFIFFHFFHLFISIYF